MAEDLRIYTDDNGVVTSKGKHTGGKGTLKGFNPLTDRALAYTNKKVLELNNEIADELGVDRRFYHLDDLVANQISCVFHSEGEGTQELFPKCISKGKLMEPKKLADTAYSAMKDIAKFGSAKYLREYKQCIISVDDKLYDIWYDEDHYHTQKNLKAQVELCQAYVYDNNTIPEDMALKDWCVQNKDGEGVRDRGQAWAHYIAHSNLVFNLQRPWATTIHKSQGSEFKTVYIAQDDIKRSIRQGYYLTYARLMYVALSRAVEKVVIV